VFGQWSGELAGCFIYASLDRMSSLRLGHGNNLYYAVFYLSPGDYHGFHAPTDIIVDERRHFSGELYPVNESALNKIAPLFCINERISLVGEWEYGFFAYSPVGAYNVGSMTLNFEPVCVQILFRLVSLFTRIGLAYEY